VIVQTEELPRLRGKVAMVDGGFDPLHAGHIAYFREASELGLPVLCNVSSDEWVARKHPPLLPQEDRGQVVDAIRYVEYTHLSRITTAEVLRLLEPRYYVKGADWRDGLPEEEHRVCADHGIEVVYLETVLGSSTAILERYDASRQGRAANS
jgi:cytidyltransferase-like protein